MNMDNVTEAMQWLALLLGFLSVLLVGAIAIEAWQRIQHFRWLRRLTRIERGRAQQRARA
jgi:hypothetical protein